MATLYSLAGKDGPLVQVTVRLKPGVNPERSIYFYKDCLSWCQNDVPKMTPGRRGADLSPFEQLRERIKQWIVGDPMDYGKFKDLMPKRDEVWEIKTIDLRLFGWVYVPKVFIVHCGGYTDDYKGRYPTRFHDDDITRVVNARNRLDLDEPKFRGGTYHELV